MKISKYFFAALLSAAALNCFAGDLHGKKDLLEMPYMNSKVSQPDPVFQQQLRNSTAWKNFVRQHDKWYVEFNEATQLPARAYGRPIQANGSTPSEAARNFMETYLTDFKLPLNDIIFHSENSDSKYNNVFFTQTYRGLEVLNSRVFIKMTKGLRVNTWSTDIYDINISITPSLSKTNAIEKSKNGISNSVTNVTTPLLKILPVPQGRTVVSHLVYEMIVSTKTESNVPAEYYTLVDANSGEILYRQNQIRYLNGSANVESTVYQFQPYIPAVSLPLRNLKIVSGVSTYFTDSIGNATLIGTNPFNATFSLQGRWSKVVTDQGSVAPSLVKSITGTGDTATFDSITTIRHTSGYFHVNNIHDFMKIYFPTFTGLDIPLVTRIDVAGGLCNAFYGGTDINFFEAGGGCNCYSQVGDIVYHEYGHGINDKVYQWYGGNFQNGAMNEGYADVWGISLTRNPVLGKGESSSNPNSFIRRYDVNRKVYPQDLHGEPHDDGEIIAGAWYDVSVNLNSWPQMTALFASTFIDCVTGPDGDEGQIYSNVLLSALNHDDNDSDLSNGTPNDQAILEAFALHGIVLMNNASFAHQPIYAASSTQPIEVTADLTALIPFLTTYMELHYRTDNFSPYTNVPMTLTTGITYSATIPQQPSGTIVSYYIKMLDSTSFNFQTMPVEADTTEPNIPYFIIVDCVRKMIEDFDGNQSPGWTLGIPGDNATGGIWVIDTPMVTFRSGGDTVQPGVQHTPGGINCAVTGNATSISAPNYNADVDGGKTTLQSPTFDLSGFTDPIISYWRWYTNDQGSGPREDYWQTYISDDGINYTPVEHIRTPDHSWRRYAFRVNDYLPNATSVTLRFVADDSGIGSLLESAVDDIEIYNNDILGIKEPLTGSFISIYPNPASSSLTLDLRFSKPGKISIDVVDGLGQIMTTKVSEVVAGMNTRSIDIRDLSNGIYHLVISNGEERLEKTFTVLK